MNIQFENDFRQKLLFVRFSEPTEIIDNKGLVELKSLWLQALKPWHTPYSALIDLSNFSLKSDPVLEKGFERLFATLKTLFMKKACGFGYLGELSLPFPTVESEQDALQNLGFRERDKQNNIEIELANFFREQVVELTFARGFVIDSPEKMKLLKRKLFNNLRLWHSGWSLLIDCQTFQLDPSFHDEWQKLEVFLGGFFLKKIAGYNGSPDLGSFPFPVYRSKHVAFLKLERDNVAADVADCVSRKAK